MSNLSILQSKLKKNKIDILIVNRSDEFLNEYISPYAERLKFITNFTGSAGKVLISFGVHRHCMNRIKCWSCFNIFFFKKFS